MSLISFQYQKMKQQIYAIYGIDNEKSLRIDILRKSVDITEFCKQFLAIQPLEITVQPCELQRKSTTEFFMKIKKFNNLIKALIHDELQLNNILLSIELIQEDLRRRILPLSLLSQIEINDKTIEESSETPIEFIHIKQKLDQIRNLEDWVSSVFVGKSVKCKSFEKLQGLYVLKTNITVPINGIPQQVIKVGMTRLPLKDRLYSLREDFNKKIVYTKLFFQYFPSKRTIDLEFHSYLTQSIPKSKFYVLKDKGINSKYSISNELYILTDEFLDNFIPYLKKFVHCLLDRQEVDINSQEEGSDLDESAENNSLQNIQQDDKLKNIQNVKEVLEKDTLLTQETNQDTLQILFQNDEKSQQDSKLTIRKEQQNHENLKQDTKLTIKKEQQNVLNFKEQEVQKNEMLKS